jgi:transposase
VRDRVVIAVTADGLQAVDVPAKLAARVRLLSRGHGRKNDTADAISVGIAALTAPQLQTVQVDQAVAALRALVEHRDDLVRARTQTVNRLHALLTPLIPAGAPTGLTADTAAQLLSRVRPHAPLQRTLRRLAADLIAEVRRLDRRITPAGADVAAAITEAGWAGKVRSGATGTTCSPSPRARCASLSVTSSGTAWPRRS